MTIIQKYGRRRLGSIALKVLPMIMQFDHIKGDVVFWAGCSKDFYDRNGCKLAHPMIECPFTLYNSEEEDRQHFYFLEVCHDDASECRLNSLVRSFYEKDEKNRQITIEFKSSSLKGYHGKDPDRAMSTKMMIDTQMEYPFYNIQVNEKQHEFVHIRVPNHGYRDLEFTVFEKEVFIHSERKDEKSGEIFEVEVLLECDGKVELSSLFKKKQTDWVWSVFMTTCSIIRVNSSQPIKNSQHWTPIEREARLGHF